MGNRHSAFTLVELLVVISIIAVLIGILVPVVGKVRVSAQETATRSLLGQIDAACQAYFGDYQAYPGPIPHLYLIAADYPAPLGNDTASQAINEGRTAAGPAGVQAGENRLTGSENLVLGLMGGLASSTTGSYEFVFKKDQLGLGAMRFNPKRPGRSNAYMQNTNLSQGKFTDDAAGVNPAKDTVIPEFIDSFSNPLPILYMRARKGGEAQNKQNIGNDDNNVVIDTPFDGSASGVGEVAIAQYNLQEIAPYTQSSIGVGRKLGQSDYKNHGVAWNTSPHGLINIDTAATLGKPAAASEYPYNAYAYLTEAGTDDINLSGNPRVLKHHARKKDQFVLISAGKDRVYGTEDDVTNFGSVLP